MLAADYGGEEAPDRRARRYQARASQDRAVRVAIRLRPGGRRAGRGPEPGASHGRAPGLPGFVYQVILRLAPGEQVQALIQNDGDARPDITQGTPVQVHLAPDALRVLAGDAISATGEDIPADQEKEHLMAR